MKSKEIGASAKTRRSHGLLGPAQLNAVADLFASLSEPSRLQILQALKSGPLSVGRLVAETGLKQANVSKQLGLLQAAGIIDRRQDGNHAFYSIKMPLVFELCDLVCDGVASNAKKLAASLGA